MLINGLRASRSSSFIASALLVVFGSVKHTDLQAQCPTSVLGLADSVCKSEVITLEMPPSADAANWDFCSGDFHNSFDAVTVSTLTNSLSTPRSISVVGDSGNWFGFVVNNSLSNLHKLTFGNGLDAAPTSISAMHFIGGAGSITASTWSRLKFTMEGGQWHALGVTEGNVLARISFPINDGFASDSVNLTTFPNTFGLNNARDIDLIKHNDSLFLVVINRISSELKVLTFGTSILNTPVLHATHSLIGFATPQSVDISYQCGNYFGLISSLTDGKIGVLKFGSDLSTLLSVEELNSTASFPLPMKVFLQHEKGAWVGVVKNRNNNVELSRIYFDDTLSSEPDSVVQVGSVNGTMVGWSFDLVQEGTMTYGFGVNIVSGNNAYRLTFENSCPNDTLGIELVFPDTLTSMNTSGAYGVELRFKELGSGEWNSIYQPLWVKEGTDIDLDIDEGCVGDTIVLSDLSHSNAPITSRSWNIDGFGLFTDSVVSIHPTLADTISFSLKVSNQEGCADSVDTFMVAHPFPMLSINVDTTCRGQDLMINNNTSILFDSINSWFWSFPDTVLTDAINPAYLALDSGAFTLAISASSNFGCTSTDTLDYYIKDAPIADLSVSHTCLGDVTSLDNLSSSSTPFASFWDLGDGNTSTLSSVENTYLNTGAYDVSLAVAAANGCADTVQVEVFISTPPIINSFGFTDVRCADQTVAVNQSVLSDSLSEVLWLVSGSILDSGLSPQLLIQDTGFLEIALMVNSGTSCFDTLSRSIYFNPPPQFDLSINSRCEQDSTRITSTIDQGPLIVSSEWVMHAGDTSSNSVVTLPYLSAGVFPVWHQLTTDSGCTRDTTIVVEKLVRPQLNLELEANEWCTDSLMSFTENILLDPADSLVRASLYLFDAGSMLDSFNLDSGFTFFQEEGLRDLKLVVQTLAGCQDSLNRAIHISRSPIFDMPIDTTCLFTLIEREAPYGGGNYSYEWQMGDGVEYDDANANHIYTQEGRYRGSLRIRDNVSGCAFRDTLWTEVLPQPRISLVKDSFCSGSSVMLEGRFIDSIQVPVLHSWSNNSGSLSSVNPLILEHIESGVFSVNAEITSQFNCQVSADLLYSVFDPPSLSVSLSQTFGSVPAAPTIELFSEDNSAFTGIVTGKDTLVGERITLQVTEPSTLDFDAFAINSAGCINKASYKLDFTNPKEDAALTSIRSINEDGVQSVFVDLFNAGTAPIETISIQLRNHPNYSLVFNDSLSLLPGMSRTVKFDGLLFQSPPAAYCAEVLSVNGRPDTVIANNEVCLNGVEQSLLAVFPNPFSSSVNLVMHATSCEVLEVVIFSALGDKVYDEVIEVERLNTFRKLLSLEALSSGVYIIAVYCGDQVSYQRIVKR